MAGIRGGGEGDESDAPDRLQVAIAVFPRFTALDSVGPYEVLQRVPWLDVVFVGPERGEYRSDNGMLGVVADAAFVDVPRPDILLMPGGVGAFALQEDEEVLRWVRDAHVHTLWTTSVCTGSLVLGSAGLLNGLTATTYWSCYDRLAATGAIPTATRVVEHPEQRIITAAGVSSGIDMALRLVEHLAGRVAAEATQLMVEYDPELRYDSGSPAKASPEVLALARQFSQLR